MLPGRGRPHSQSALANVGKPIDQRQAALIQSMYAGHPDLARSVSEGFTVRDTVYKTLDQEMKAASRGAVSAKGFALSAQRIGTLMRDRFNLAFVDVGGWDHACEPGRRDPDLSRRPDRRSRPGSRQFLAGDRTGRVAHDHRGRRVGVRPHLRENGDRGTDHGHGSIYWVLAAACRADAWRANRSPCPRLAQPESRPARADRLPAH